MKNIIAMILVCISSASARAVDAEFLKAVLSSKLVSSVHDIKKIEVVPSCPSCADVIISGRNANGENAYVKVRATMTLLSGTTLSFVAGGTTPY